MAARPEMDPAVYRPAGAQFVSDAYSNIYAPLLPALIPRLGLSFAAAGTLAMLFQLSASVSGSRADHVGIEPTLTVIALLLLLAALCAVPLPGGGLRQAAGHLDAVTPPSLGM